MKLAGARAADFCARPGGRMTGALLFGPDGGLVALRRRELAAAITGGDDLRLTRLGPADAVADPAGIDAALRARGFFPGRRVVLIEGARDALARPLTAILASLGPPGASPPGDGPEDAFLLVTADNLPARSALRRLFEGAESMVSLGLYPEPPDTAELSRLLQAAGLEHGLEPDAANAIAAVASQIGRGELMQLIETISVFALSRVGKLPLDAIAPLLPAAADSELDRLVAAVADGRADAVGPLIGRLAAAGIGATGMLIAAGRHFRQLLGLATAPDGIGPALGRLRPPAFGPRRRALAAQARRWGSDRLETANRLLFQADRTLRSAGDRPARALVERCLIRLAMMVTRG